jgi:hypothetical protein
LGVLPHDYDFVSELISTNYLTMTPVCFVDKAKPSSSKKENKSLPLRR